MATYDVVVVGAGLGGLTAAALLAARGLSVCVVERGSRGGGCAASVERFGYTFEPGAGLYASWEPGGIHERVFAELPERPPEVEPLSSPYVVRLPDGTDVDVGRGDGEFYDGLARAFPECARAAVRFYRELAPLAEALERAASRVPDLLTASRLRRARLIASEARQAARVLSAMSDVAERHMAGASPRFRLFVDAQLQIFGQRPARDCAYLYAAVALWQTRRGMYSMRGGAQGLADALARSVERSGGRLRFDSTALRLDFDAAGRASGVVLLSGETVEARRAVVSNLTAWDTYGKLVGSRRIPADVRARLKSLRGWGAYLLFLGVDEETAARLPNGRVLALTGEAGASEFDAESALFMFASATASDTRAPGGKRAATVSTFTEAERWFTFHEDDEAHEQQDQAALETWWARLHAAMPELGDGVEVIETATPRTFHERTRRRLGMVGGAGQSLDVFGPRALSHRTSVPNLFMVGDTVFPGQGVAAVTHSALVAANEIAPRMPK